MSLLRRFLDQKTALCDIGKAVLIRSADQIYLREGLLCILCLRLNRTLLGRDGETEK